MKIVNIYSNETIDLAKNKIQLLEDIVLKTKSKCIFTKGVFDLLHYGHLSLFSYLEKLKKQKNCLLVVGVTSDKLVKTKKGENRPINPEHERILQIALLSQVDYVFLNNETDLSNIISSLQPDYFIKGMDTTGSLSEVENIMKSNLEFNLMKADSEIIIFCDEDTISTSTIINRIK